MFGVVKYSHALQAVEFLPEGLHEGAHGAVQQDKLPQYRTALDSLVECAQDRDFVTVA